MNTVVQSLKKQYVIHSEYSEHLLEKECIMTVVMGIPESIFVIVHIRWETDNNRAKHLQYGGVQIVAMIDDSYVVITHCKMLWEPCVDGERDHKYYSASILCAVCILRSTKDI